LRRPIDQAPALDEQHARPTSGRLDGDGFRQCPAPWSQRLAIFRLL
jgi:hypothetical protein